MKKRKRGILGPPAHQKRLKGSPPPEGRRFAAAGSRASRTAQGCIIKSQLQQQCSVIVGKLLCAAKTGASGGTVKGLCLAPHILHKRAVYAVVCETLKHAPLLTKILDSSGFLNVHPWIHIGAALVLLYDHLLGQGVKAHGKVERAVLSYSVTFKQQEKQLLAAQPGAVSLSELIPQEQQHKGDETQSQACRYIRCNTIVTTTKDVVRRLHQPPSSWSSRHQHHTAVEDIHHEPGMPAVLAVPVGVIVYDHPMVTAGQVVIQGRSSCMPAHALSPQPGWTILDCCAAPGNKTTQIAAMVGKKGTVIACEKDQARCELLRRTVARCQASNVQVTHQDFLKVDPHSKDYMGVQAILLDPSCSGSGTMSSRMDYLIPQSVGQPDVVTVDALHNSSDFPGPISSGTKRVKSLASFQTRALQHALSFPNVRRVVYSTCSVYVEENENVIAAVMPDAEAAGLYLDHALPFWHRRGLTALFPWAEKVVRVHPELDGGDGFFVAVFQRNSCNPDWST